MRSRRRVKRIRDRYLWLQQAVSEESLSLRLRLMGLQHMMNCVTDEFHDVLEKRQAQTETRLRNAIMAAAAVVADIQALLLGSFDSVVQPRMHL